MPAKRLVCLVFVLGWVAASTYAQTGDGGTITGHVRGPGGVSVPGATVQLINPQSGERKETWTDESGDYTLTGLPAGTYKLEISLLGFRSDVREPIPVTAGVSLKVNASLVFSYGEESAPQVARGANGGNGATPLPAELMRERGAMMEGEGGLPGSGPAGAEGAVRVSEVSGNGNAFQLEQPPEDLDASASAANSFLLAGGTGSGAPTPGEENRWRERVREFRQRGEGQSVPGFGGGGGPGGGGMGPGMFFGGGGRGGWAGRRPQVNRVRGNIFDRYSNSALDASPYPLNVAESPQIASYREDFGVGLGGPLVIPKVYNGSDKTTFFFNYGLSRSKSPFDSFATVPTLAERGGDFSQAIIGAGPLAPLPISILRQCRLFVTLRFPVECLRQFPL